MMDDKTYRAVVFDLDGTLLNTLPDLADSGNAVLAAHGRAPHAEEEYRYLVGNGSRVLMERLFPDFSSAEIDAVLAEYKKIYAEHLTCKTHPYDGIIDLLRTLQAKHIPVAICTNKHASAMEELVKTAFGEIVFDLAVGERPEIPCKPDPTNVLYILEKLQVRPDETVYLGDTSVDMETAVRAGCLPVGVLWGFREKEELVGSGAKVLLSRPNELLEKVAFAE